MTPVCKSVRSTMGAILVFLVGGIVASAASATSISMSPNPARVDAFIGHDFSLRLDSGSSLTNRLNFTISGAGGCGGLCPSTAVAMIVFDGTTVLSARDADGGLLSPGNVVRGFVTSGGSVAGLLIDAGAPSSEAFTLRLSSTPTTATLYALNLDSLSSVGDLSSVLSRVKESTRLTFSVRGGSTAVPEPSAALVFGSGLVAVALGMRRKDA